MQDAATEFLASLSAEQRAVAQRPFDDPERRRWFYTPTDHGGLRLDAMNPLQEQRALRLLASVLSEGGYNAAVTIMGLENVLDHVEGWSRATEGRRGRDPGQYQIAVFGAPGDEAWGWRLGGHHLSINVASAGDAVRVTPCFFGADPAFAPLLGDDVLAPLGGLEAAALALASSLSPDQRAAAVLSPIPPVDLVLANLPDALDGTYVDDPAGIVRDPSPRFVDALRSRWAAEQPSDAQRQALSFSRGPQGLPARALGPEQQVLLATFTGHMTGRPAPALAAGLTEPLDALHVVWAGGTRHGDGHYARVQGDRTVIEYVNTQRGANHIHSVLRELE